MVNFLSKDSCYLHNVSFGENVTIYENNHLENCRIGDNVTLLPGNYIIETSIGEGCKIHNSVIEKSEIGRGASIGPWTRIRPNSVIGDGVKLGNFVEIKNSKIGSGSKVSHLAYVGDSEVGKNCNVGCGVIFANYDGQNKHKITVGDHVFIGSNCNLIAPLFIGDDSYICAGTTVTQDVEKEDFVIGRVRAEVKPKRAAKYWPKEEK